MRRIPLFLVAFVFAAGCSEDDPVQVVDPGIVTDLTDPAQALAAHAQAWQERDLPAYLALLEKPGVRGEDEGFRFYVRDEDVDDIPWMPGGSWDYEVEDEIVTNMFNDEYLGEEAPIRTIEFTYNVLQQTTPSDGITEIVAIVLIRVLVAPDTGWLADTKLLVTFARDADGYQRIRSIREMSPIRTRREEASFGSIKLLYH